MKSALLVSLAAALAFATLSPAQAFQPPPADPAALRDAALASDTVAWDLLEGLTTEVGQRMAGTEAEARARAEGAPAFSPVPLPQAAAP